MSSAKAEEATPSLWGLEMKRYSNKRLFMSRVTKFSLWARGGDVLSLSPSQSSLLMGPCCSTVRAMEVVAEATRQRRLHPSVYAWMDEEASATTWESGITVPAFESGTWEPGLGTLIGLVICGWFTGLNRDETISNLTEIRLYLRYRIHLLICISFNSSVCVL